jgi:hypothetical protein
MSKMFHEGKLVRDEQGRYKIKEKTREENSNPETVRHAAGDSAAAA